ncbi:hypothetical protein GHT09_001641 [Marmota monax]|uniref:Uncharacterized protein n=1 Tax=Marmota monax TaxID=9995 RepID=A0A834PUU5_MARMO|nr:hypothetical protein GHT09_001641 [Marmota monax]
MEPPSLTRDWSCPCWRGEEKGLQVPEWQGGQEPGKWIRRRSNGTLSTFLRPPRATITVIRGEDEMSQSSSVAKASTGSVPVGAPGPAGPGSDPPHAHPRMEIGISPTWAKTTSQDISGQCPACQQVNAQQERWTHSGVRNRGELPGDHWEIGFTEVRPPSSSYTFLFIFVDTFSGWPEVYPTKFLLNKVPPGCELPVTRRSAVRPAFTAATGNFIALTSLKVLHRLST